MDDISIRSKSGIMEGIAENIYRASPIHLAAVDRAWPIFMTNGEN
jgi:hypothetical protein